MKVKVKKIRTMTNELWQDLNEQQTEKIVGGMDCLAFIILYNSNKLSS